MPASQEAAKVALITGCSSGIGRATALCLHEAGWTVYATARKRAQLDDLARAGMHTLSLDVTDEASMTAAVRAVEDAHGAVGVLINNAGYSQSGAIEAVPLGRVRAQFETNVFGAVRMIQLVLPGMRAQRSGRIVNLSSMGGKLVFPGGGYYHATKYAIEAISDALRFEVKNLGIDVIIIEPGLIKSSFADTAVSSVDLPGGADSPYASFHAEVARVTQESYIKGPLAKMAGTPETVAKVIAKALAAKRPRPRYTVTASAKVLLMQRKLLTDRAWDRFLGTTMQAPGRTAKRKKK
jgi:NADP-dependent 3-hydroxy acid dehydrogenase YdfG